VLLAAGIGLRLRPLTSVVPKALCPVGNITMLDRALTNVASLGLSGPDHVAVNAWHLSAAIVDAVGDRAHVGVETGPEPLGSAGGIAALRDWIDGRDVVVANADAYLAGGDLSGLTSRWTGAEVRMLGVRAPKGRREFGTYRFAGFSVIPWHYIERLRVEPADLVRTVWRPAESRGRFQLVDYRGDYIDCGTPADYLAANLHAAGARSRNGTAVARSRNGTAVARSRNGTAGTGARQAQPSSLIAADAEITGKVVDSVVGAAASVAGEVERSVVWADAVVAADEHLSDAIRFGTDVRATVQ